MYVKTLPHPDTVAKEAVCTSPCIVLLFDFKAQDFGGSVSTIHGAMISLSVVTHTYVHTYREYPRPYAFGK